MLEFSKEKMLAHAKKMAFEAAVESALENFKRNILGEKTLREAREACLLAQCELIETLDDNQSELYNNIIETNEDYTDFLLEACFNAGVELGMKLA